MVAQQKITSSSSLETEGGVSVLPTANKLNPGSPKSRLAKLKRSSTKAKVNGAMPNDPFRFQGNGVDFKGKLIGEREVSEARGDAMIAEAMRLAKASVKSTGSHKQRIILNISIEGLKIKDEKTGTVLYNFPVAKISFVARDTADARAFAFIFGTATGKHKFYGIKTAQTADHAVLSIRDMFEVVFEMKKKQIMEVKQKQEEQENMENFHRESAENGESCRIEDGVAVADLLDLESELQNLEQGFNQLQNIPSMPEDECFLSNGNHWSNGNASLSAQQDPFGDSFNPNPLPAHGVSTLNVWPGAQNGGANGHILNGFGVPGHSVEALNGVYSGTNPFAMLSQSQPASTAFNSHMDPFDTQSAHRVITAINNTHLYPSLPVVPSLPLTPPTPSSAISLPAPIVVPTEVNWGIGSSPTLKENKAPPMDFVVGLENDTGIDRWDEQELCRPAATVTTLEEAFNKLVDMNQLVSVVNTTSTRKNPFEHIINPPKVPLNALATSGVSKTTTIQANSCSAGPLNGHSTQMGIKAGASSDPFNDDFFN